jgi:alpha-glucosidase/alpha-D-xyloside xylohydrolase
MRESARISGRPEMPPLWSLGYLQSHRTLTGPDEILRVAPPVRMPRAVQRTVDGDLVMSTPDL